MPTIYIENRPYEVKEGPNLLHACLDLGFDIPYFCWHPALHSVGACRLCAVKQFRDENDTRGRIIMSCMTPVTEGLRISVDDPEVRAFRAGILELLMTNHPHDCPVCDEGGECHLQDMTLMTGHVYRRFRFKKRTYQNQDLGPFLNHEMNRCIHCYRCVRFYRDYAGGRDLEAYASHHHVYFGRHEDGVLQNVFSGNLAEVCPTGVFTDKTFKRHFTRNWDLQTAPSVCVHCGLGCNTIPGERYGTLRRIRSRYNEEVNGYFLCDRGRFGYEFVNHPGRIRRPFMSEKAIKTTGDTGNSITKEVIEAYIAHLLHFGGKVIGIGSPRTSLEANYALRTLVGQEHFFAGMSDTESELIAEIITILRSGPARAASLQDVAMSDAVLVLGEDLQNTAPMMALALRQAARNRCRDSVKALGIPEWNDAFVRIAMQDDKSPIFIAAPDSTGIDELAERTFRAAPDDLARMGFAVAHAIVPEAPRMPDIHDAVVSLAHTIAEALKNAKHPLIICGTSCGNKPLIHAAANIAWALCKTGITASLAFIMPECNSMGLGLLEAGSIGKAIESAALEKAETVIILENDLYLRAQEKCIDRFLDGIANVVVISSLSNRTTERADTVLPAGTFAESSGTLVNSEGRAQHFFKVFVPEGMIGEGWQWLRRMLSIAQKPEAENWKTVHDVAASLAAESYIFKPVNNTAPPPEWREAAQKIPRQSHRFSGRTAMVANRTMHEPPPPDDPDSPLSFSMEGYSGMPPGALLPRYWYPAWNSVQSLNKFQTEVGGPLRGGNPGERLLEPAPGIGAPFFDDIPEAFMQRESEWLFMPFFYIFGSEELSRMAPAIAQLSPGPHLSLNADDASHLGLKDGDNARITLAEKEYLLPVRVSTGLPRGVSGLPAGMPPFEGIALPCRGSISGNRVTK
jgi:NADH-quinone oxidoreductase subunit G